MSMSKKHYRAVADVLLDAVSEAETDAEERLVKSIAGDLAAIFKADNARFDRARFLAAVTEGREIRRG